MTKIDPSLYLSNQPSRSPSPELGKDEFLKILMTQLQSQDPTNPMDDREFISQMAEFSSLEQMMNMTNSIDTLVQSQLVSPVIKYSHMIGKEVTYQAYDEETGEKLDIETSKVIAVSQKDGWAILELENGEKIYADAAIQVSNPDSSENNGEDPTDPENPEDEESE
ncbi:MAG: flagellar hook assembly protein FlgD [Bacillota bacterium]|uniref:Flagellar hook assembly protein FlgD n=1 Tax=Virgibacillus salarius TaxID=447199 RepID=A0A941IB26_9BACI|nr:MULTISPECIES: flagellar hook assembly protein FlgD [Bacillaceae]NAZ07585.1 flagellar hook assembly protein FlgD [Agaribacter marinus]MBR7794865.1 flagellar hook assembly protein FlgD [Virgibacillus salarius]MCC2249278.1 flagellar hook assembly protein FlgD [Virgibacillus sp. AGTR]MDY7043896.1 flagellar hook assembly protein FlgD [Virgibacillus sp. M23]QRZ17313.1 flagellar hook assembly protein FlgD [Virgibacillus sp. AGTR]